MKIAVVGTGYVGLVTGTCLSEAGNEVTCIDIDAQKIAQMQDGIAPIYEPGLEPLFKRNIQEGRLRFTTDLRDGAPGAAVIFLALPTPQAKDGSADLSYIFDLVKQLGPLLAHYTVIVNKSTVPVGTAEKVQELVAKNTSEEFDVVSNPEFLREGRAIDDFRRPDRVVIGTSSDRAFNVMRRLYKPFVMQGHPIMRVDVRSAEMTKYAANAWLAKDISFMNQLAWLAEKIGADVDLVRRGISSDHRIPNVYVGPGWGGSCFPKDTLALLHIANAHDFEFSILEKAVTSNEAQKRRLAEKVSQYYGGDIQDKIFALWGLAFKPDTDDIRDTPALEVIDMLTSAGASIVAYDPEAMGNARNHYKGKQTRLSFAKDEYAALRGADALIIVTDWPEFKTPDLDRVKKLLKAPVIFDGRNLYDLDEMAEQQFYYESIGRRIVKL